MQRADRCRTGCRLYRGTLTSFRKKQPARLRLLFTSERQTAAYLRYNRCRPNHRQRMPLQFPPHRHDRKTDFRTIQTRRRPQLHAPDGIHPPLQNPHRCRADCHLRRCRHRKLSCRLHRPPGQPRFCRTRRSARTVCRLRHPHHPAKLARTVYLHDLGNGKQNLDCPPLSHHPRHHQGNLPLRQHLFHDLGFRHGDQPHPQRHVRQNADPLLTLPSGNPVRHGTDEYAQPD